MTHEGHAASKRRGRGAGASREAVAVRVCAMGAIGAALLAVTGCTSQSPAAGDGRRPGERPRAADVERAAETLRRAGSSRALTSMEVESGGTRLTIEGTGVFDLARGTGRLRVTLPPGAGGARPGERRPVPELLAPGALYMKNRGAGVPADKWVRVDTTTLPDGNLVTGGATDPLSAAELLGGARRIRYEGTTALDGVRVWRFTGVVDMEAAAVAAGSTQVRRQLRAAEKGFSGAGVPFDAYFDERGRLRKVQHRFTVAAAPAGSGNEARGGVEVLSTTRLHGFGARADISFPEPGDIYAGKIALP
ncbi:hypothetical protein [Streptomyces cacaoi]|uniref:hypothetical protein n=1 Tax=Streptomyces cacaoi TaxID=1898 RepID=UPI0033248604